MSFIDPYSGHRLAKPWKERVQMCKFHDIIAGRRKKDMLFEGSWVVVFLGRPLSSWSYAGYPATTQRGSDRMVMVSRVLDKVLKPDKLNYELLGILPASLKKPAFSPTEIPVKNG